MTIGLLDPGLETHDGALSSNLGDVIIQRAVTRELRALFGDEPLYTCSTQEFLGREQRRQLAACRHVFVGGSNLLSSNMLDAQRDNPPGMPLFYRQWLLSPFDVAHLRHAVLFGVGWWQYQRPAGLFTRWLLRAALSGRVAHSVRDNYTAEMLRAAGIARVLNTGCPTMWPLADLPADAIPTAKADDALVMLTDYNRVPDADRALIELLGKKYRRLYLWPEGRADVEYVAELGVAATMLEHRFDAFDEFVRTHPSFDYVGTRLHGGIYCLLHRRRALVLGIDNRAREIAKDTGLPTADRSDVAAIERWIDAAQPTTISMPTRAIAEWRSQFRG